LPSADIRVFLSYGNHDAVSKLTRSVPLPKNVFSFPANRPATEVIESLGVAIHGQSFATEAVTTDLSAAYPAPRAGLLNIGVLHTALSGREGHQPYAPTTADRLTDKGYDYWALGHVHNREIVRQSPWIVFPGNTQGRHARETGAKGCMVVEAEPGVGIRSVEFVPTDVARWHHLGIDIAALSSEDDLHAAVQAEVRAAQVSAEDRMLALRLTLAGRGPLHHAIVSNREAIRAQLAASIGEASAGMAWLEKVRIKVTAPLDLPRLAERDDPIGLLIRSIDSLAADPGSSSRWPSRCSPTSGKNSRSNCAGPDSAWALDSPEALADALANARERLLAAIAAEDAMKIEQIDLKAYGHFTSRRLLLGGAANLHIICGPNEAGKTTLWRAINGALFGIPERTQDSFLHEARKLRIGLALDRARSGERLAVMRRKGRVNTLLRYDPTTGNESARHGAGRPSSRLARRPQSGAVPGHVQPRPRRPGARRRSAGARPGRCRRKPLRSRRRPDFDPRAACQARSRGRSACSNHAHRPR
jgi:exonuclease SbcD